MWTTGVKIAEHLHHLFTSPASPVSPPFDLPWHLSVDSNSHSRRGLWLYLSLEAFRQEVEKELNLSTAFPSDLHNKHSPRLNLTSPCIPWLLLEQEASWLSSVNLTPCRLQQEGKNPNKAYIVFSVTPRHIVEGWIHQKGPNRAFSGLSCAKLVHTVHICELPHSR